MKKICLGITIVFFIIFLTQIQPFVNGILQRGWSGTNYGRVIIPLFIAIVSLIVYRKKSKNMSK